MTLRKFAENAVILSNEKMGPGVFGMRLSCQRLADSARPGMFFSVKVPDQTLLLRRPFGFADADKSDGSITMYYRILGKGTAALSEMKEGGTVNCLGPLGNGFSTDAKRPLIVGGGMGLAPLLFLAKEAGKSADTLIGGRNREEVFWSKLFKAYSNQVFVTTDDGSTGIKGFVTDLMPKLLDDKSYDMVYTCGPEIMMKKISALASEYEIPCQVSLERRMACGLGACLSCGCDTKSGGRKKVCKDGPVFWAGEVF